MKKLNINDLAKELGVSKTTISFVINGKGDEKNISKKTQKRIFNFIEEHGYKPNIMAQSLKSGKTYTIAYLVPDIANPFFAKIGRIIEDKLAKSGYQLLIGSTDENPQKESDLIDRLYNRQVDGFILATSDFNQKAITDLIANKVPVIFFDRESEDIPSNYVVVENRDSMNLAVSKLIEKGNKKIGLFTFIHEVKPLRIRVEGYKDALIANGIEVDHDLIRRVDIKNLKESIRTQMEYLFSKNVDGIVFTNNQIASETLWHFNMNFRDQIGKISLATFDNVDGFDFANPPIMSLAQPVVKIANIVVDILNLSLKDQNQEFQRVVLNPDLIVRGV